MIIIVVGYIRYNRMREQKLIPPEKIRADQKKKWGVTYRNNRMAAIATAVLMIAFSLSMEVVRFNFTLKFRFRSFSEKPIFGILPVLILAVLVILLMKYISKKISSHSIDQLRNKSAIIFGSTLGMGLAGFMGYLVSGNVLNVHIAVMLGVPILYMYFPKYAQWKATAEALCRKEVEKTGLEPSASAKLQRRLLKIGSDTWIISLFDPRLKRLIAIPFIGVFFVAFGLVLLKPELQQGTKLIFLFLLFLLTSVPFILLLLMDRGFEFDRNSNTPNEFIRIYRLKRNKIYKLVEFNRIMLQRGQRDYIFEVNVDGPSSWKNIITTLKEGDARWFSKELSTFLSMELIDET